MDPIAGYVFSLGPSDQSFSSKISLVVCVGIPGDIDRKLRHSPGLSLSQYIWSCSSSILIPNNSRHGLWNDSVRITTLVSSFFVFAIGVSLKQVRSQITVLFAVLAIALTRSVVNQVVYQDAPPPWGPHALLTPIMAIAMVYGFRTIADGIQKEGFRSSVAVTSTLIAFLAVVGFSWGVVSSFQAQFDRASAAISRELLGVSREFDRLGAEARGFHEKGGYFISEEFVVNEFMTSSHVSSNWLVNQVNHNQLIRNASFAVVSKQNQLLSEKLIASSFVICSESSEIGVYLWCQR